jgi:hypothetical protein
METHPSAASTPHRREHVEAFALLAGDLRRAFAGRLEALVAYGPPDADDGLHTLALIDRVTFADLAALVRMTPGWRRAGLAVPLVLGRDEFRRTLDVFPLEYGDIIANHATIVGSNPFAGLDVSVSDLRRGCEAQVKSHLIHLREGFLEAGSDSAAVARLMAASAPAFRTILRHVERLDPGANERAGLPDSLVAEVANAGATSVADPSALFARYVAAVERLWQIVDAWRP